MPLARRGTLCSRHSDRIAFHLCDYCHTPICEECAISEIENHPVCSHSCADKLAVRLKEEGEEHQFEDWKTRIWTSVFLTFVLTLVGAGVGLLFSFLPTRFA